MSTLQNAMLPEKYQRLAPLINRFAQVESVLAIALSGSQTQCLADEQSDYDIYIYTNSDITFEFRSKIAEDLGFLMPQEIGNHTWEPGDEWILAETGVNLDIMYRQPQWIENQLDNVLIRHEAHTGYSTCFWHNILQSVPLFDRNEWFSLLKKAADRPYPFELKMAIISKNLPLLSSSISSYMEQISKAIHRRDGIAVNHRLAAFLASAFDIIFAANSITHPGEKRLLHYIENKGINLPKDFVSDVKMLTEDLHVFDAHILTVLRNISVNITKFVLNC